MPAAVHFAVDPRSFLRREEGSATIEAVIWLPVLMAMFCLAADSALIFAKQAEVMRVVQDANRAMSVGRLTSADATEAYIAAQIAAISPAAEIETTVTSGVIATTVTMPSSDLAATGMIPALTGINVSVTSQHMSEA